MESRIGQQFGDYRLTRFLGRGTFGDVYIGEHIYLKKQVAVKVLRMQLTSDKLKDFINEARTFRLRHPTIVQVLDFGIGDNDTPFLVMDYAPNGTVLQRYPRGTRLPLAIIVSYVRQIADALQYAHDQRLIHRDLKPENILLGPNNEALITDFGIATVARQTTTQSMQDIAGTATYMAPEQFRGMPRPASDQYALGIMVYEWLCGEPPFKEGDFIQLGFQHTYVAPPPLQDRVPSLPPAVEHVVMIALAKDSHQRFASIKAFATALEQASAINQASVLIPPLPPISTSTPPMPTTPSPTVNADPLEIPHPASTLSTPSSSTTPITTPSSSTPLPLPTQASEAFPKKVGPQPPTQTDPTRGFGQTTPATRSPSFGPVIGVIFLIVTLVGGGIFFFTSRGNPSTGNTGSTFSTGSNGSNTSAPINGKGCTKIGVLLPETATSARWDSEDRPLLQKDIPQLLSGATVDYNNAQGNADLQQTQAQEDLTKGDCILVIAPSDSIKAAAIVSAAKAKGVPVIAYDRLIYSNDLNYYVSFDNTKVGQLQGQYIADHYQSFVSSNGTNNTVMIDGSQTDNNALLFAKGAHSALDPLFNSGSLKNVYEKFTPNWDNATAQTEMQAALTANQNKVAIVYVANDGMANNVIAALKAVNLNGKVLVTGQDATVAGIHNILAGDQAMTAYKAINRDAMATAQLVAAISNGTDITSLINGQTAIPQTGGVNIPSVLETPVAVDKTNISSTVLADGFVTKADICQGLPSGTDGIC